MHRYAQKEKVRRATQNAIVIGSIMEKCCQDTTTNKTGITYMSK
jgi:hypothetical protein